MHFYKLSLDSKNTVRLADFDKSIKWAEKPEEIKRDLQVISIISLLSHLSTSLFVHYLISHGQFEDILILTREERTSKAYPQCLPPSLPCRQWHFPGLMWSWLLLCLFLCLFGSLFLH